MKTTTIPVPVINRSRGIAGVGLVTLFLATPLSAQDTYHFKWQAAGVHDRDRSQRPAVAMLRHEAPEGLKAAPAGLQAPLYGSVKLGPPNAQATFLLVVDAPGGQLTRFFMDGNANGDLTDDPACEVTNKPFTRPEGTELIEFRTDAMVKIPFADGPRDGKLKFYIIQTGTGKPAPPALMFYSDYGLVGDLKLDGQTIPAILEDSGNLGHFRLDQDPMANPTLWLGIPNPRTKQVGIGNPAQRPFEANGKWWAVANLTLSGDFQIVPATKPATPVAPPTVDLSPGKKAPEFIGKLLDGKTVKFPGDYAGKVVLLDFWATWCGPCVAELPNVIKAYGKFHDSGLEVLGISLDKAEWETKLADFTQKKNMPWPQVYDGKFWAAEVAKLYGIQAIPHTVLVDGDTGVILADKVRGEALAPAIEKALAAKKN
jgi:peroxiredoxin